MLLIFLSFLLEVFLKFSFFFFFMLTFLIFLFSSLPASFFLFFSLHTSLCILFIFDYFSTCFNMYLPNSLSFLMFAYFYICLYVFPYSSFFLSFSLPILAILSFVIFPSSLFFFPYLPNFLSFFTSLTFSLSLSLSTSLSVLNFAYLSFFSLSLPTFFSSLYLCLPFFISLRTSLPTFLLFSIFVYLSFFLYIFVNLASFLYLSPAFLSVSLSTSPFFPPTVWCLCRALLQDKPVEECSLEPREHCQGPGPTFYLIEKKKKLMLKARGTRILYCVKL